MSNIYQSKIQKHSSFLQKIIEESGKSDNPNIINMSIIPILKDNFFNYNIINFFER